ncbi:MAG TPA: PHP-associated domain-containing protein [Dehalococcoidia bacterium]|nr:PHP-associated domain-containing protein [Dehalococcoidia bacterium]
MTLLDMHNHSLLSDDARASVEQYAKWLQMLRGKGLEIDGFVLTEHRQFDPGVEYEEISGRYELKIFNAAELDTDAGHFLVYGVSPELRDRFNFADVTMHAEDLVEAAAETGGIAVPAHVGRYNIGFCEFVGPDRPFVGVSVVEHLNGGSNEEETARAAALMAASSYVGLAGSDAHFVNRIGRYLTRFLDPVSSMEDIVEGLRSGRVETVIAETMASRAP